MQGEEREYRPKDFPGVVVTIKSPTEREKRRLFALRGGDDAWADKAVERHVVAVAGHTHRGRAVTTAAELSEYGSSGLFADVVNEIITEVSLTEGEGGPSGAPSGSSGAASSTGGAGTA